MTCQICHNLSLHQVINVDLLRDAIANHNSSCDTCLLLSAIIEQFNVNDDKIVLATKSTWTNDGPELKLQIQGIPPPIPSDGSKEAVELIPSTLIDVFCAPGGKVPHPAIKNGRMIASHSSSDQSFAHAATWIKECEESHKYSCSTSRTSPLPTRVIDVKGRLGDGPPFLLESKGRYGRYATLSYCWGSTDQEKLTSTNIETFKKALPLSKMSKTVTDAIMISKILQIQYLWVDALCILQDDYEDWNYQSNQMRQVYSESFLTLAASSTADCSEGIFTTQNRASQRVTVKLRNESIYASVQPSSDKQHIGPFLMDNSSQFNIWSQQQEALPLCRRAWALQERVMSNRVLYYTTEELWWECNEGVQCECGGPEETSKASSYRWLRNPWLQNLTFTQEMAYLKWRELVTLFSAGALTRPEDKLPAISGLAKQFEVMLWHRFKEKDLYCAGLWKSQLVRDLLWHASPISETSYTKIPSRPVQWRAPSWSWASIDGIIQFPDNHGNQSRYFLTIVDVNVETRTQNIHDALVGGHVILEGPSLRSSLLINRSTDESGYVLAPLSNSATSELFQETTLHLDDSGCEIVDGAEYLYVLAGASPWYKTYANDFKSGFQVEGSSFVQLLVLKSVDGAVGERYERIGLAVCKVGVGLREVETHEMFVRRRVAIV
jgi:hypothetical protein